SDLLQKNEEKAHDFCKNLQENILKSINKLSTFEEVSLDLVNQFLFLTENKIINISQLNKMRIAVISSIKTKLQHFDQPSVALKFLRGLEKAKPACLDKEGKLSADYMQFAEDYAAWEMVQHQGQLLSTNTLIANNAVTALQSAVKHAATSSLPQFKKAAENFKQDLQRIFLKNINELQTAEKLSDDFFPILEQQFRFYVSDEAKPNLKEIVLNNLDDTNPVASLAYINRWENIDVDIIKHFDGTLYQVLQDKKNQYQSLVLLQTKWADLLDDKKATFLSAESVNELIAAVLWLDKPHAELNNPLIATLEKLTPQALQPLQLTVKEKIAALKLSLTKSLADLFQAPLTETQRIALQHRLQFVSQANGLYTQALGELRSHIIEIILTDMTKLADLKNAKRYLNELYFSLPVELRKEPEIAETMLAVKLEMVKKHFTDEQRALHEKYQNELEFLRSGELSLWEKIEASFTGNDPKALTEKNINQWRTRFLQDYIIELNVQADKAVNTAAFKESENVEESKILLEYLQENIAADIALIAKTTTMNLVQLTDMRRRRALAKLDKIFGLEPEKPVDINLFMLRYVTLADYQKHYADDPLLGNAGRHFIQQFQDMAQHEGGFTTQFVAQLPLAALETLYETCVEQPLMQANVNENILGVVNANQDAYIQLPRYLLLNMVLELIVADIDALLRGKKIDNALLNARLAFAMPKLVAQVKKEHELNQNSEHLRELLLNAVQRITKENAVNEYKKCVAMQMPKDFVKYNLWGIISNFPACEAKLFEQLKFNLQDQMNIITGLNPADLNYDKEEKSLQKINVELNEYKEKLARIPGASYRSSRKLMSVVEATEEAHLQTSIANLEKQKNTLICQIETKKVKAKWSRNCQDQFAQLNCLLENNQLCLKDFVKKLDPTLFDLLSPELAAACAAIKQNIVITDLFSLADQSFEKNLVTLKDALQDAKTNILDIIRDLPESVMHELAASANKVREFQYRCADHFKCLLIKMLDENHLLSISTPAPAGNSAAETPKPAKTPFWGAWFASGKQEKNTQATKPLTPKERLQMELANIDSENFKCLLNHLVGEKKPNEIGLQYLYEMQGISMAIDIEKKSEMDVETEVGNPTARIGRR
ncbi:MAG: hypothetical protein JO149_00175, partial [Gammaproteobacteria bacterium]|nr:hypothetical protein [Gammaproteobacteria bacterium]